MQYMPYYIKRMASCCDTQRVFLSYRIVHFGLTARAQQQQTHSNLLCKRSRYGPLRIRFTVVGPEH